MLKPGRTFLLAALVGMAGVMVAASAAKAPPSADVQAHELPGGVWITGQVKPEQLSGLVDRGFRAVVDLRPDGEAADQPGSSRMSQATAAVGLSFTYIPVRHGTIAADAVDELGQVLTSSDKPVLLYCGSGRRAARTWALAEASRSDGLDEAAILRAVREAGQDASELQSDIARRIALRAETTR
ncbi:beta-lactamase hydrolase domain-containing protein [Frateuria soli]|uniref:beta-lactamase hydrolase domain-containing protein n=1 Tax=Frateuria soli TaxID=1542730 RepID=UPI001E648896|nr:sulfur transferase domain-containing protein [Frateuria soli]UGB37298.1 hypothetical protein LQ771_10710 [Frateuria soli]